MAVRNYSSTAVQATLSSGITNASGTCVVSVTTGFPAAPFIGRLDADTASEEVVLVTNVAGTTLTITRGYDSTSAQAHSAGATFRHSVAAIDLREPNTHVNASTGVHGVTGSVVGSNDTQTLSNKTLTTPAIAGGTLSGTFTSTGTITGGTVNPTTLQQAGVQAVTISGTQTLTGKTLTSPAITTPTITGSGGALTLPAGPDTLVGRATTDTLANKTLTTPTITSPVVNGAFTGDAASGFGASTAYTPVLTASTTSPTLGTSPTQNGQVNKVGREVDYTANIIFGTGSPTAGTGVYRVSLPYAAGNLGVNTVVGYGFIYDSSATLTRLVTVYLNDANTVIFSTDSSTANVGAANPWTWAASDQINLFIRYIAAS